MKIVSYILSICISFLIVNITYAASITVDIEKSVLTPDKGNPYLIQLDIQSKKKSQSICVSESNIKTKRIPSKYCLYESGLIGYQKDLLIPIKEVFP